MRSGSRDVTYLTLSLDQAAFKRLDILKTVLFDEHLSKKDDLTKSSVCNVKTWHDESGNSTQTSNFVCMLCK